ncbi:MAG TPA: PQQ-dependent sugar dehydrogenase [Gemmatimonadales bacterium]|nr:PQQ-dependent sugar dehydrogenase [Gemmatimonadales bacterium]
MRAAARYPFTLAAALAAACGGTDRAPAPGAESATSGESAGAAAPAAAGVTVPEGFHVGVFAENLGSVRHAVAAGDGVVYVNTLRSTYDTGKRVPPGGFVVALRDTDGDGKADVVRRFGPTSESGSHGGTGIAISRDRLYVEADSAILRYALAAGDPVPSGEPDTIVKGLPIEGGHTSRPFVVDGAGSLFVNVGSETNACQAEDRQAGSRGRRPCTELERRAGIWRFSSERTGQRYTPGARYATGIRNANGLAVDAGGRLYATQHGRDQLAENWPKLFDWKQSAELPAEELLRIEKGGDYGWPYCYYDGEQGKLVLAPEYGGDGKQVGDCGEKLGPVAAFPAHWAPNALAFYHGTSFPARYRGGAFIAFHGSWNRAPEPQAGYNVTFQPMKDGKASGAYEVFADGFAGARKEPGLAAHRPAGLAVGPSGELFITDDQAGTVWRVTYNSAGDAAASR